MRYGGGSAKSENWKDNPTGLVINSIEDGTVQEHFPDLFEFTEKSTVQTPPKRHRKNPDEFTLSAKRFVVPKMTWQL